MIKNILFLKKLPFLTTRTTETKNNVDKQKKNRKSSKGTNLFFFTEITGIRVI